ncbi:transglycosylase SLT domain-containing protein [Pseudobacteriovorax antillogorgiicola]|uniref:Soluble lytic murein transglycosylase n=1 Tax=Pseudobacteriovorax antillogorgiicola TaxID=1513793 RepID=A0A1Y6BHK1_9BACT|nr:transglycosylase SLT domain-containing protein [Pseudobacteriovorax antillogorgiicola]TCS55588.1 soluble lytic murein transglycosylase-like protein [Pseudobacteriovorax antillogorgiicola]SMF10572.1 Soluble lytic murein transglycosylase [Pseudobacteriovorax antillogorgiicola]
MSSACLKTLKNLFCIAFVLTPATSDASPLDVPRDIAKDIRFWEKIFSVYSPSQCVYHDTQNLDAVFAVWNIPHRGRHRRAKIRRQRRLISRALVNLGRTGKPSTRIEKKVFDATPSHLKKPSYWRKASRRVRCQLGVDLQKPLERSGKYLPMIIKALERHRLPLDLKYLPYLESGFHNRIRSKANARGLWQLIPEVARNLGLRVSRWRDERTHPYRSTIAALRLLKDLKRQHRKWSLAITAYNYGTNGMRRAIRKYGYDYSKIRRYHKTRVFRFAAKNYYPSLIAVRNVVRRVRDGERTKRYRVKSGENLTMIARRFGNQLHEIVDLNHLSSTTLHPGQSLKVVIR